MTSTRHIYVVPTVVQFFGGFGDAVGRVSRAVARHILRGTGLDSAPFMVWLPVDFPNAADPIPLDAIERYGVEALAPFTSAETHTLDSLNLQSLARSNDNSPMYEPIWKVCPREILRKTRGSEASQRPAIGRGAFVYRADEFEPMLQQALEQLAPNGPVVNDLRRQGLAEDQIAPFVRVVFAGGAGGGTCGGCLMASTIMTSSIAARINVPIQTELVTGHRYRATNGAEAALRLALEASFARDIEIAQTPGERFALTTLSGFTHTASGELFTRVLPFEGNGRLSGKASPLALAMGETIAFRSVAASARNIESAHAGNIMSRSRIAIPDQPITA